MCIRDRSVADVAADIGPGLAKATLAGVVNGTLVDASTQIANDATLAIITSKDDDGLHLIRHSTAHLMAQSVKQLYPESQVTIGPVIEDGFYYDFAYERPFTPEDLTAIEKRMAELAKQAIPIVRSELPRDEAVAFFSGLSEEYKAEIISDIPSDEVLSLYEQGDFTDLCRGPHVPDTGKLGHFKLMKLAGAYWRGDSNNAMLQRIYGTHGPVKKSSKTTCIDLKRRRNAITARLVNSLICSICRKKHRVWCSGTRTAGLSINRCSSTCASARLSRAIGK